MKRCTKCGEEKELSDFFNDSRKTDGKKSHCRSCCAAYKRRSRAENPEKWRAWDSGSYARQRSDADRWNARLSRQKAAIANDPQARAVVAKRYADGHREQIRSHNAEVARERYRNDPAYAARCRAVLGLTRTMGVPISEISNDLIEAKTAHLLVHRFIKKGK